jgi:hypothetical protein
VTTDLNTLKTDVFTIWPIGYITRLVTIFSGTDMIEPPALTYTFGAASASTGLAGDTFSYNIFDHVGTVATIKEDTNGATRNIWDIFMPYWDTMVYLSLLVVIVTTLMHAHLGHVLEHKEKKKTTGTA